MCTSMSHHLHSFGAYFGLYFCIQMVEMTRPGNPRIFWESEDQIILLFWLFYLDRHCAISNL